jgi:hypothetical protein
LAVAGGRGVVVEAGGGGWVGGGGSAGVEKRTAEKVPSSKKKTSSASTGAREDKVCGPRREGEGALDGRPPREPSPGGRRSLLENNVKFRMNRRRRVLAGGPRPSPIPWNAKLSSVRPANRQPRPVVAATYRLQPLYKVVVWIRSIFVRRGTCSRC